MQLKNLSVFQFPMLIKLWLQYVPQTEPGKIVKWSPSRRKKHVSQLYPYLIYYWLENEDQRTSILLLSLLAHHKSLNIPGISLWFQLSRTKVHILEKHYELVLEFAKPRGKVIKFLKFLNFANLVKGMFGEEVLVRVKENQDFFL